MSLLSLISVLGSGAPGSSGSKIGVGAAATWPSKRGFVTSRTWRMSVPGDGPAGFDAVSWIASNNVALFWNRRRISNG